MNQGALEDRVGHIYSTIYQSKSALRAGRGSHWGRLFRLSRLRAESTRGTPAVSVDVVEIEAGRGQQLPKASQGTLSIHAIGRSQNHYPRVESLKRPYPNDGKSSGNGRVNLRIGGRNREHLSADDGRPIAIHVQRCPVAADQITQPQAPGILENLRVHLPNSAGERILHAGKLGLRQRGQPHIRQGNLRIRRRCRYDQQRTSNLRYRAAGRMSILVDDLGEQIVALLPRLRRFARTLTRSMQDADDLVQISVERALSRADQLRADSPLAAWMFGILRNAWIDEARARTRRNRVLVPEELGENVADPAGHQHAETISVEGAMASLPAEQREVIGLVLIEGLSYKEAAEVMNIPVGTVTSRLARGRDALQAMLGAGNGGAKDKALS